MGCCRPLKMLRAVCGRRAALYKEKSPLYGIHGVYEPTAAPGATKDRAGSTNPFAKGCPSISGAGPSPNPGPEICQNTGYSKSRIKASLASMHVWKATTMSSPTLDSHCNMPIGFSQRVEKSDDVRRVLHMNGASQCCTVIKTSTTIRPSHGMHGWNSCEMNVFRLNPQLNSLIAYSSSAKVGDQTDEGTSTNQKYETMQPESMEDSQREEMVGLIVDGDISAVANELRQAQQEMIVCMRKCSRALFAVGTVHLMWGGMMFCVLDSPLNHAVMTEVCMSTLVVFGLAYQLKQTLKPVEFFTKLEEHRRLRVIFLSRQVSRMLGAFFYRGYGIGFVLSLTLTAHLLSCMKFFF